MAAKTLILLRHAKSDWHTGEPDLRRPLAARGEQDAVAAGRILAGYALDVVLASRATRVQQTWARAVAGGASCADVRTSDVIYDAWPNDLLGELRDLDETRHTALLIGHQPTLAALVIALAQPSPLVDAVAERFPTCALAVLSFAGPWRELADGGAELVRFEVPRG